MGHIIKKNERDVSRLNTEAAAPKNNN
jgi:hypothetical protein